MNVLISGSDGFLGTNFIRLSPEFIIKEICLIKNKVEDVDFQSIDTVLHLAALVHQMKGASDEEYFRVNRDLTYQFAFRAKKSGVKHFIFMSTVKVYGESTTNSDPWDEGSKCLPEDAYGKSKLEAEKLIRKLEDDNFKVSIIRAPLIYGPGVKGNLISILKLVNKFPILPLGNIKNKRSMVYVGNIIELIKHIIKTSKSGVFLGGDNRVLSTTELCQIVAKGLNKKLILISIPNLFICMAKKIKPNIIERLWGSLEINNHITNQTLVFTPPYSVEYGMAEMICWFKSIKKSNGRIL